MMEKDMSNVETNENVLPEIQEGVDLLIEELLNVDRKEIKEDAQKGPNKDSRILECKICKVKIKLMNTGKYANGNIRWKNEDGKIANGRICPDCNVVRAKSTMKKTRASRKSDEK